jgi:hypothetical protein
LIRFLAILARFAMIVIGYTGAAIAASLFLNLMLIGTADRQILADAGFMISVTAGALFVGYFAFLPAIAAIIIGEIAGKRDWLFYAVGGAVCGAIVVTLFWASGQGEGDDPALSLTMIAAAIFGAWVYWLIAGRNAGQWRRPARTTPSPPSGS